MLSYLIGIDENVQIKESQLIAIAIVISKTVYCNDVEIK